MKPHRARIFAMQAIYQKEFQDRPLEQLLTFDWIDYQIKESEKEMAQKIIKGVLNSMQEIDSLIKQYSQNWNFNRITPIIKAILRISIYQLHEMMDHIPPQVTINEGVQLAKEYGEEESTRFVNGILDGYYQNEIKANQNK